MMMMVMRVVMVMDMMRVVMLMVMVMVSLAAFTAPLVTIAFAQALYTSPDLMHCSLIQQHNQL